MGEPPTGVNEHHLSKRRTSAQHDPKPTRPGIERTCCEIAGKNAKPAGRTRQPMRWPPKDEQPGSAVDERHVEVLNWFADCR